MASKFDQDLADKALAEEFGAYISTIATKIVTPIKNSAQKAQSAIHDSAQTAQSSIGASLKQSEDSFQSLIDTVRELGIDLKSTVASVYDGHETTRKHLIDLLQQHRDMAKVEATEQVRQLGQAMHSDLEPRLEELVKPVAEVAAKASLRQMEVAKQIGERLLNEFRDSSVKAERRLDTVSEKTSRLMLSMAAASDKAAHHHRQLIMITGIGVAVQVTLLLLIVLAIWR